MNIFEAANLVEEQLKNEGYCRERWGSGCTMFGNPIRDVQFGLTDKVPTQEFINSITPEGFETKLHVKEDNFSIYVSKIETPEETIAREKAEKEWEEQHADDQKASYKESVPGSGVYDTPCYDEEIVSEN